MSTSTLTIFGAGLIGGSVAFAARKRGLAQTIIAVDVAPEPTDPTPFDRWVQADDKDGVQAALGGSDLTVLCVPVSVIIRLLPRIIEATPGVVTDCGSTKAAISRSTAEHPDRQRFVPGHPMAGHPEGGLKNAREDLFVDRKWIVCRAASSAQSAQTVRDFVTALGAEVVDLNEEEHDRSVAITSHVPQVVASALSVFANEGDAMQAAGPGFASATRVAGGAEAMWRDIFETNAQAVGAALSDVGKQLQALGDELQNDELGGALEVLEKARKLRSDPT